MNKILDFYALTRRPYIHATGWKGTALLLDELRTVNEGNILELGFGTGQTLVDVSARLPRARLYAVEKSAGMMNAAMKRLQFCRVKAIPMTLLESNALPFSDGFFNAVYAESVLAFLPESDIRQMLAEIFRVLHPGGTLLLNESLWRKRVTPHVMATINAQCLRHFGIPQANTDLPFPEDWAAVCRHIGFDVEKIRSLEGLRAGLHIDWSAKLLLSKIYTISGKIRNRLSPALRRQSAQFRQAERSFEQYGPFLEGFMFKFRKPA